jgi:hypothetical protein
MYRISNCIPYAVTIHINHSEPIIDLNYIERFISDRDINTLRLVIIYIYKHTHMTCMKFLVVHKRELSYIFQR